ncbi:MAG: metallophosphoesterase [Pseudomonadales bacterium]
MRIHQVTDLHVPDDARDDRFSHVRENVLRQFHFVDAETPDLFVISGDLTMTDGSATGCQWIRDNLPNVPVVVIPGNHDDPLLIQQIFGAWPLQNEHAECSVVFLDTSSDRLPPDQIAALEKLNCKQPCLLFLHHPPHLIGSGFMSKNQPLLNCIDAANAISASRVGHVFCGHYHNAAHVSCEGFELYLTPSPAFQIALNSELFMMEEFQPAVRTIHVESGRVSAELAYV